MKTPVNEENRTLYLPLDKFWILGAGVERELNNGNIVTLNLEYVNVGEASVDQTGSPLAGRVKGEYDDNYAMLLDFSYRFGK